MKELEDRIRKDGIVREGNVLKVDNFLNHQCDVSLYDQMGSKFAQLLLDLRTQGKTVLMASHDLDFVQQVADTVSMMFDGEIASTEPVTTFFANNVYYRP